MKYRLYAIAAAAVVAFSFACGNKKAADDKQAPGSIAEQGAGNAQDRNVGGKDRSKVVGEAATYKRAVERLDAQLRGFRKVAAKQPKSWLQKDRVASLLVQRAQLTGDYNNYAEAQRLLEEAFELAPAGTGPFLGRASLNFSLHRLAQVEPDLAAAEKAIIVQKPTRARIAGLRAEVALHSGRYVDARHGYRTAHDLKPTPTSAFRLSNYAHLTGDYKGAEEWIDKAEALIDGKNPQLRAWLHLQRGLLDLERNRLDDAMAHYRDGAALFSGWWLIEEHMAEIDTLQGRVAVAEKSYRDLIERTGDPEFMEALADILAERGAKDPAAKAEAEALYQRARATYLKRLELLPEASWGHALGHFLGSDDPADTAKALELAKANHEARPGGEAKIWLAQAHAKAGQLDQAVPLIENVLSSPFRTPELHATAALILRAAGQTQRADEQEKLATAIHPEALAELTWLKAALTRHGSATRPGQ